MTQLDTSILLLLILISGIAAAFYGMAKDRPMLSIGGLLMLIGVWMVNHGF